MVIYILIHTWGRETFQQINLIEMRLSSLSNCTHKKQQVSLGSTGLWQPFMPSDAEHSPDC